VCQLCYLRKITVSSVVSLGSLAEAAAESAGFLPRLRRRVRLRLGLSVSADGLSAEVSFRMFLAAFLGSAGFLGVLGTDAGVGDSTFGLAVAFLAAAFCC